MVRLSKSEYGCAYKVNPEIYAQVHAATFGIRCNRRQAEANHNRESFIWDDSSSESRGNSNTQVDLNATAPRPPSVPLFQRKHEKFVNTYNRKLHLEEEKKEAEKLLATELASALEIKEEKRRKKRKRTPKTPPPGVDSESDDVHEASTLQIRESGSQTPDWSKMNADQQPAKKTQPGRTRPKKPNQEAAFSTVAHHHPSTAAHVHTISQPPFVQYGCCDNEILTCPKRTHNVKSPVDVYAAALRAQKRRLLEIKQREEEKLSVPLVEKKKEPLFNDFAVRAKRETSQWDTEYRSCYRGFEKAEYLRIYASRAQQGRPKSNFTSTI